MKIIKFSKNLGKISVQKNFDACILFADEQPWSKNPALKKVLEILHKSATPVLLIPSISRRGDSAEAFRLGISGYLRTPFSTEELVSILTLLCAKESRFLLKAKGIITRHIVQELAHPVGLALVASFSESSEVYAEQLNDILGKIGLRVKRTRSQKEFFEELFSSSVNFIFFPAELSFGLQRQVGVALKGQSHITVRYRTDARGKDECKTSTPDELMIQNTNNFSEVLQILQRANLSHDITHRPTQRRRAS